MNINVAAFPVSEKSSNMVLHQRTLILSANVDQKSLETEYSIAICRSAGGYWQSNTLLLAIFELRSSIVQCVSDCHLSGVSLLITVASSSNPAEAGRLFWKVNYENKNQQTTKIC